MLSEDFLTIEPFLFVEPLTERKLGMINSLLIPNAISFAEDGLPQSLIVVDHLVVHEGWQFGLGQLGLGA